MMEERGQDRWESVQPGQERYREKSNHHDCKRKTCHTRPRTCHTNLPAHPLPEQQQVLGLPAGLEAPVTGQGPMWKAWCGLA